MIEWSFPSRCFGPTDGPTDAGLQWFKDDPIRALARELCQNSLDAAKNNDEPVRIEFKLHSVSTSSFPGSYQFKEILGKCDKFWKDKPNKRKDAFLNQANRALNSSKISILQVSDYNTLGLEGAFEDEITVWKSLVQGNGITMKNSEDAAGSFGIGKAAPFVNSLMQTVFYRTLDEKNVSAAQGVAQLISFDDDSSTDQDSVRRAVGYYGEGKSNKPVSFITELDQLAGKRNEMGTDVFIMGFNSESGHDDWYAAVILEILENFYMSIINGKLVVTVGSNVIDKESVLRIIARFCKSGKGVACFKKIFSADDVIELTKNFHGGKLNLKLLYGSNLNKNILVTRSSGMKIAEISALPKGISYTGILEIQGSKLNAFFKDMEDPQHRKWDVKRHENPQLAKEYKQELENWVKTAIVDNGNSQLGESTDVIIIDEFLNGQYGEQNSNASEKRENVIDDVKKMDITVVEPKMTVRSERKPSGKESKGTTESGGSLLGFRTPTQEKDAKNKTGRNGTENETGNDKVHREMSEVRAKTRVISNGKKYNLKFTSELDINEGKIEITSIGENGKDTKLKVKKASIDGHEVLCADGNIQVQNVIAGEKRNIEFELMDSGNFGMRVNVYGN